MTATAQLEPPAYPSAPHVSAILPLQLLSDERLTRLASAGDRRAFAAIYQRHHQGLYRYCHSILGSPDDAHDALQSTWLAALAALEGERREISLKAWLYRVVLRTFVLRLP